jgi:hypothetical protein
MSERAADVAAVLWPAFLSACLASLLFFAAVDPEWLRDASPLFAGLGREAGYALGFFFFFAVALCASALSVYLIRSSRREQRRREAQERCSP